MKKIIIASLVCFFILVAYLIYLQPIMSDDYMSLYLIKNHNFIKYVEHFYFKWSGTLTGVFLQYYFLKYIKYKFIISLINTTMFMVLIYIILFYSNFFKSKRKFEFLFIYIILIFIVWFSMPMGDEVLMWITGSVYLWFCLITLIYLFPYYHQIKNNFSINLNFHKFRIFINFIIGIFVGLTSLLIIAPVSSFLFVWIYQFYKVDKIIKYKSFYYSGILGFFIGSILNILAPGNYVRLSEGSGFDIMIMIKNYIIYLLFTFINTYNVIGTFLLIFILLFTKYKKDRIYKLSIFFSLFGILLFIIEPSSNLSLNTIQNTNLFNIITIVSRAIINLINFFISIYYISFLKKNKTFYIWLISGGSPLLLMFLLPGFQARRTTIVSYFFFILMILEIIDFNFVYIKIKENRKKYITLILLFFILFSYDYYNEYKFMKHLRLKSDERISILKENEGKNLSVPRFMLKKRRFTHIKDLSFKQDGFPNNYFAKLYKLKSIKTIIENK